MIDDVETALYVSLLSKEFCYGEHVILIHCITDNKSLCDQLKSNKYVSDKRLRIDTNALKELTQSNKIHTFKWISTEKQIANCLTKHGTSTKQLVETLRKGQLYISKGPE